MKFLKLFIALTLMGFILPFNVSYANKSDSTHLEGILGSLRQSHKNIDSMKEVSIGYEGLAAANIENEMFPVMLEFKYLINLEELELRMNSAHDKLTVKALIAGHVESLKPFCLESIGLINQKMTMLSSPALLSEIQHARDDLAQGCEIVQNWK